MHNVLGKVRGIQMVSDEDKKALYDKRCPIAGSLHATIVWSQTGITLPSCTVGTQVYLTMC